MLVRDVDGRLVIIGRNDCKNEQVYNEKIYNSRKDYTRKYKGVSLYTNNANNTNNTNNTNNNNQKLNTASDD
jgi:hypothetical protein